LPSRRRTAARVRFHWAPSSSGREEPRRLLMPLPCLSSFSTLGVDKDAQSPRQS
jgi:hypothetical protein